MGKGDAEMKNKYWMYETMLLLSITLLPLAWCTVLLFILPDIETSAFFRVLIFSFLLIENIALSIFLSKKAEEHL